MKYIEVTWKHLEAEDPTTIYSELDADQWEQRKVEVYSDGHRSFADKMREVGGSILGLEPWPDLARLGKEPEFEIKEISKAEFESIWAETVKSRS